MVDSIKIFHVEMKTSLSLYEQKWPRTVQTVDHRTGEVSREGLVN